MSFNPQDIRKIGFLARIEIDDSELEPLADELSGIIEWVEQLNEVDTAGIQPMTSVTKMLLPQRQDEATDGDASEQILANAPDRLENFYTVPKVVD